MDLQLVCNEATTIARDAGRLLREAASQQKRISRKSSDVDLLTEYDQAAEALISDRLRQAFPDHRLVAEEGSHNQQAASSYTWYVDPLDGTNNFAHGFPVFAVSMALYRASEPQIGIIYDPLRDECFSAVTGGGAYLETAHGRMRLRVSTATTLVESLLATGFPYDRHHSQQDNLAQFGAFLKKALGLRRAGAAALDLAYVAAGRLDGYWEFKLNSWDVAAGLLLVQEAGGRVSTIDGRPLQLTEKLSLLASNGRIHDQMQEVLDNVPFNSPAIASIQDG
jgi:myo-inositol-1(or 4)-monophosphatase